MTSPVSHAVSSSSKRRSTGNQLSVEDNALDVISKEADTRDEKSSAVLAEARKLRLDEREKHKKENEDVDEDDDEESTENSKQSADNTANIENIPASKVPTTATTTTSTTSTTSQPITRMHSTTDSRPVLEHSSSRQQDTTGSADLMEKYKKVLLSNAQLDNEKRALKYEVDLLKDRMCDVEESNLETKRSLRISNKEKDALLDQLRALESKCQKLTVDLIQRDHLIKTSGLALVTTDNTYTAPEDSEYTSGSNMSSAILTAEHLEILADYTGSLGDRLKKLFDERNEILEEKEKISKELSELKSNSSNLLQQQQTSSFSTIASPVFDGIVFDDAHKNFTEIKLKLKKAEQEITTLQGNVTRLETQLTRYKSLSENLEKSEEELKVEKRKLQLEARMLTSKLEELESKNNSLTKRLEKLKNKNLTENN
ncbi:hypothetical protein HELRODRAFT_193598 [Helobdella robusta]|uniref:Uncharacterized protein n=1 Tax=Helobdella robusta TaxID=6412 RepID=T1FV58_HELRO|nr:hypothetical protein HELRODRAFT_193598 [Helobdella robusta]ESN95244.1 hypothetical protein HELRODRAFT_193598 [Helobdella robusta]